MLEISKYSPTAYQPDVQALLNPTRDVLGRLYALGYSDASRTVAGSAYDVPFGRAAAWADQRAGDLIKGVDETVRSEVRRLVAEAELAQMTEAALVSELVDLFGTMGAHHPALIADTETAMAANIGNLSAYRDLAITEVMVSDGTESDEECAAADGETWTIDEAEANPLEHPNCGRSFDPILPDEAPAEGAPEDAGAVGGVESPATPADEMTSAPTVEAPSEAAVSNAVQTWGSSSVNTTEMRASIAAGAPTSEAQALVQALDTQASPAPVLYRGMALPDGGAQVEFRAGQTIDLNLSSFSADLAHADIFMDVGSSPGGLPDPTAQAVRLVLSSGAQALNLEPWTSPTSFRAAEREWITAGRFHVDAIVEIPNPWGQPVRTYEVHLTQIAVMR